jgi:hypothetical protein
LQHWIFAEIVGQFTVNAQVAVNDVPAGLLTPQQLREFQTQGYLVIDKPMIDFPEISWCASILMRLIDDGAGRRDGRNFDLAARDDKGTGKSLQILRPSFYAPQLRELSFRRTALEWAKQLIGPDAEFAGDQAILKPSHRGGPTPWHQDEAFRDPAFDYHEISIWIALTDVSPESSPMAYVPGSHRREVLPHRLAGGGRAANTIEVAGGFDPASALAYPIPAGAMIIHHCRTIHGAPGNITSAPRLAYILSFSTPPTIHQGAREFPWLTGLRGAINDQRRKNLWRGTVFMELIRMLRSDVHSHKNLVQMIRLRLAQYFNYKRKARNDP